jgi:two-component system sensor histidine kinase BaeS
MTRPPANQQLRAAGLAGHRDLGRGCLLEGDPDRLHQIVGTLMQNCARRCRQGTT